VSPTLTFPSGVSAPSPSINVTLFLSQSIFTPLESDSETAARRFPSASQSREAPSTVTPRSALLSDWS
jgi:hypothetical protein